ncbi:MAG: hypothetical protein MK137_05895 [Rickettsiales bacterium]|nr:hypothetical protein [Rickettsiales bacterium]
MTTNQMIINNGELLPLHRVRKVSPMTSRDYNSLKELNAELDPSKFNSKIDIAKQGGFFVTQTVEDFHKQGIKFVQISEKAYIPSDNIVKARDLTEQDRADFKDRTTRSMPNSFKSRISTTAGTVLANVSARELLGRMEKPFIPPRQAPNKTPEISTDHSNDRGR